MIVHVRRHWNDQHGDFVHVDKLGGFHWSSSESSIGLPSPRPMINAYVWCDDAPGLPHPRVFGECPHRIKACIVKKLQTPEVFNALKALADRGKSTPAPGEARTAAAGSGFE